MIINLPAHVQWLVRKNSEGLAARLKEEGLDIRTDKAFEILTNADPSKKKGAVDWLVKTYLNKGFFWEDVESGEQSKVWLTLKHFGVYRKNLQGKACNLTEYQAVAAVYGAIQEFIPKDLDSVSNRSRKREERDRAMAESLIVLRSEDLIVSVPLTEAASKWWGRGTQWCTASVQS